MADHLDEELADDSFVVAVDEVECFMPPGGRLGDVVRDDGAALLRDVEPDDAPVGRIRLALNEAVPDQGVHHRGQRARTGPGALGDLACLQAVVAHQDTEHAEPGQAQLQASGPDAFLAVGAHELRGRHHQRLDRRVIGEGGGVVRPGPVRLATRAAVGPAVGGAVRPHAGGRLAGLAGLAAELLLRFRVRHVTSITEMRFEIKYFEIKSSAWREQKAPASRVWSREAGAFARPGCRYATCAGTNSVIASASAAGLSTGTHVLAPGTGTSRACGKSDASRRA